MHKTGPFCVALAALFVVAVPSSVIAAPAIFRAHDNFVDSFPDQLCGIKGTSVVRGVDNFQLSANNTFTDNLSLNQTFTATASQKSVVLHVADHVTGLDGPIDNGDGTVTFITTFRGLPEQVRIANGPLLFRDAGTVTLTTTFAVGADGNFTLVSQTISGLHGPHPDLTSNFTLFCNALIPGLT